MNIGKTHKEPTAYRGTAKEIVSAGDGVPYANPLLPEVIKLTGFAPEGLVLVTSPGIAVGIDKKGYLAPAGGEIIPIGITSYALRSTKPLFDYMYEGKTFNDGDLPEFTVIPSTTNGSITGMDDLQGLIPQVYQHGALFERGYAWKNTGASKALFDFKPGCLLRPISADEINTAITNDTLPILFGETKSACPKTKGYYAGMLVRYDSTKDKPEMVCARLGGIRKPAQYDNIVYTNGFSYGMDLQGMSTHGQSRNVWYSISTVYGNKEYTTIIADFYVTM